MVVAALLGVSACSSAATSSGPAAGGTQQAGNTQTGSTQQAASTPQATGPIVPANSTLHWHSCSGQLAQQGVPDCTMLSVPVNYADPGGRHISLALDMIPATVPKSQQQGVMLVNPGGPGGDGLPLAAEVAQGLSPGVAASYDIVGFDPRGVGSSVPALSCDPGFFSGVRPNYVPANAAAEQVLINRAKMYATDCEQRFGWLLPYMTTQDVARDMDSDPRGVRRVENKLLRVLLWHLYRPGLRHSFPRASPPDGPGQHRRSHRGLVRRQCRAGLRLPGTYGGILRLGG